MLVVQESFDDARTASVAIILGSAPALISQTSGRVTASTCVEGSTIHSGMSVISVDGTPLVNLATSVPMWRDLAIGDQGPDVDALFDELVRLGAYNADLPKSLTQKVVDVWRALAIDKGVPKAALPLTSIAASSIVWLPEDNSVVASCDLETGQMVAFGQTVITLAPPVLSAHLTGQFTHLPPGERTLQIDDSTVVPVDTDGQITDPAALSALASSSTVQFLRQMNSLDSLTGTYALTTAIEVSVVPPAAIVASSESQGCVLDNNGSTRTITIVSSQLGQSFVTFDDLLQPPRYVLLDPPRTMTCP